MSADAHDDLTDDPLSPSLAGPEVESIQLPIMGGGFRDGRGHLIPFTGGKPKSDWSGLETGRTRAKNPMHCRPTDLTYDARSYSKRIAPPTTLLSRSDPAYDIHSYMTTVARHLDRCGMDSIMYVPDTIDPSKMLFIPHAFRRTTLSHVIRSTEVLRPKWDIFDEANDETVQDYLLASLSESLRQEYLLVCEPTDSAAVCLMRIVSLVADISITQFERSRESLKTLSPVTEPGQNVRAYCLKVRHLFQTLRNAGEWQWTLLLPILNALSKVSVETFACYFRAKIIPCTRILNDLSHADEALKEHMLSDKELTVPMILSEAELHYGSLVCSGDWGPAGTVTDPNKVKEMNLANMTVTEVNALIATAFEKGKKSLTSGGTSGTSTDSSRKCYNCGGMGHVSRDCRDPPQRTWRAVPPSDGKTTQVRNGTTYNWCTKCKLGKGFWTSNHTSESHKSREGTPTVAGTSSPTEEVNVATMVPELPWLV